MEEGYQPLDVNPTKKYIINVVILSFSFFLVFVAFNGTQNLETSVNGNLGNWGLGTTSANNRSYIVFVVCLLCHGRLYVACRLDKT